MSDESRPPGPDFTPPGGDGSQQPPQPHWPPPQTPQPQQPSQPQQPQPQQPRPQQPQPPQQAAPPQQALHSGGPQDRPAPVFRTQDSGRTSRRGSIALGIGIAIATVVLDWILWLAIPTEPPWQDIVGAMASVLPFGLVLAGIVLAVVPRTTRTGAGILLAIGGGVLILGGLCIALIAGSG